jgi:hypothetical protein
MTVRKDDEELIDLAAPRESAPLPAPPGEGNVYTRRGFLKRVAAGMISFAPGVGAVFGLKEAKRPYPFQSGPNGWTLQSSSQLLSLYSQPSAATIAAEAGAGTAIGAVAGAATGAVVYAVFPETGTDQPPPPQAPPSVGAEAAGNTPGDGPRQNHYAGVAEKPNPYRDSPGTPRSR